MSQTAARGRNRLTEVAGESCGSHRPPPPSSRTLGLILSHPRSHSEACGRRNAPPKIATSNAYLLHHGVPVHAARHLVQVGAVLDVARGKARLAKHALEVLPRHRLSDEPAQYVLAVV